MPNKAPSNKDYLKPYFAIYVGDQMVAAKAAQVTRRREVKNPREWMALQVALFSDYLSQPEIQASIAKFFGDHTKNGVFTPYK